MAYKRKYNDIQKMAKVLNERMRQFEKRGMKPPSYRSLQATLEAMGKHAEGDTGRRFSVGKYYTWADAEMLRSIMRKALNMETSTVTGAKAYYDEVWASALANKELKIKEMGITREQWFEFWEEFPNKEKNRTYDSGQTLTFLQQYIKQKGKLTHENKVTAKDIAREIQAAGSIKEAYAALGLKAPTDKTTKDLGAL